jgi:GDP-L-fucose synthase
MNNNDRIYVAGHRGLVGSALVRNLQEQGFWNLIFRTHSELDLSDAGAVDTFFRTEKPDYVFLAAAKVGGIMANNTYPVDFLRDNLHIQLNVLESAYRHGVQKLLFLWSSCIYPKMAPQPISESSLLTGLLEATNEPYALAKIAGIKLCQSYNRQYGTKFIACMPTNLYGPYDNFDLETSHVMPAMIRKFHEAKVGQKPSVTLWWDGTPFREFLYSDDMARACIHLMQSFSPTPEQNTSWDIFFNIGTGQDISILDLALLIKKITGYEGEIVWDTSRPNGTPKKLLDVSRIQSLGWRHTIELEEGIKNAYTWFLDSQACSS